MDVWSKSTANAWSIANILHKAYKDRIRYNESESIWEYYNENQWIPDKNKQHLKQYFIYDARINILNYLETLDDILDINRLTNVSKYLSTHFTAIVKEAKEIFNEWQHV